MSPEIRWLGDWVVRWLGKYGDPAVRWLGGWVSAAAAAAAVGAGRTPPLHAGQHGRPRGPASGSGAADRGAGPPQAGRAAEHARVERRPPAHTRLHR